MKESLTTEQRFCIHFPSTSEPQRPHLVIEAGAGAGKTFVLTEHVYWRLVEAPHNFKLSSNQIFIVTFTRSAENEISERIRKRFQQSHQSEIETLGQHVHVSTIDSLFHKLLESQFSAWWEKHLSQQSRLEGTSVFSVPRAQLVSDDAAAQRLDREFLTDIIALIESHPKKAEVIDFILCGGLRASVDKTSIYTKPTGLRQEIIRFMLTEPCLNPAGAAIRFATRSLHPASEALLGELKHFATQAFYQRIAAGEFTHTDRTVFLHLLFCQDAHALAGTIFAQTQPEHFPILPAELIVDEYQDTNRMQHEILFEIIRRSNGRMIVVGDPKQSIYGFRQAHVGVFQSLFTEPAWTHVELLKNFRSDPQLLEEINQLSKYCFDHSLDALPDSFLQSSFYQNAHSKRIGMKSLTPGLASNIDFQTPDMPPKVFVLSASLNAKRFAHGEADAALTLDPSINLFHFELWGLARYLKEIVSKGDFSWNQIAVLCERNSQIEQMSAILKQLHIPIQAKISKRYANNPHISYAHECAHILFDLLLGPIPIGALYKLLISPLVDCDPALVDGLGLYQNPLTTPLIRFSEPQGLVREFTKPVVIEFFSRLNQTLAACRNLFSTSPFAAWQKLRFGLKAEPDKDFLTSMNVFAEALASLSETPKMEKLLDALTISDSLSTTQNLLREYVFSNIPVPFEHSLTHAQDNALTLQTVHGAKGLEWPCVVFWPYSRASTSSAFTVAQGESDTFLKWLSEDTVDFSVFQRTENTSLAEPDCTMGGLEIEKTPSKKTWFIDLQNTCEELFERQRVFYTALTRAKKQLVLMSPFYMTSKTRSSLRDTIGKVSEDDALVAMAEKFKRLEESMLARYLDENFHLRKPSQRGTPPPAPWHGREGQAQPKTPLTAVGFFEYGPDWYETCVTELRAAKQQNETTSEAQSTPTPMPEQNFRKETPLQWRPISVVQLPAAKQSETLPSRAKPLSSATSGVRFHAAQESLPQFAPESLIGQLYQNARFNRKEWELWIPDDLSPFGQRAQFVSARPPRRKVIDLLLGLNRLEFLNALASFKESEPFVIDEFERQIRPEHICFVIIVDFKTGRPTDAHRQQVAEYGELVKKLASKTWLQRTFGDASLSSENVFVCGFVQYVHAKIDRPAISKNDPFTLVL